MDLKTFRRIVANAIDTLPKQFRDALENLEIVVEEWPTEEELAWFADREGLDPDDEEGDLLLGLYQGTPLPERHESRDMGFLPDRITLYRKAIEEFCEGDEKAMAEEIRVTLLHEIGHYFGIEDERLEELGYG
jgi:predicted Zn-dependent protease with MMP-like domain